MKLSWTFAASLAIASVWGAIALKPLPNLAQNSLSSQQQAAQKAPLSNQQPTQLSASIQVKPSASPVKAPATAARSILPARIAQNPPVAPSNLGQEILQDLTQCVASTVRQNPSQASTATIEATAMQCVFKVVMLAPDGSIRPDANERMIALVKVTGISVPQPVSEGQASVQLQSLKDSGVFTVPVTVGGQSRTFLLDTGASNSMLDSQLAQQLGLKGTPIPSELLSYMAVGEKCSEVKATLHPLPALAVESATVEGLNGMGLPNTSIPGNLSGVLGLDFLSSFDVLLNPQTKQLQLLPHSSLSSSGIPLEGKMGLMTAQVKINGQGPFTFLLDTGADLIVVSDRLATRLSLDVANAKKIDVQGFCGKEDGKQTSLAEVSLQQHQEKNLDAIILDNPMLELLGVEGIIGQNFLSQYQQHWQFGQLNELGFPAQGSLVLSPLK